MNIKVLYEDNHILVVEKPAGILTQGDYSGQRSLLHEAKEYIRIKYSKPGEVFLGPVHRLDRNVSGILLFARTSKAAKRLHQQFLTRNVKKYYLAVVSGTPSLSYNKQEWVELVHHLRKQRGFSEVMKSKSGNSKPGKLNFIEIADNGKQRLLLVRLITGRKHQVRAQLSFIGLPVAGDRKYGSPDEFPHGNICLHALSLHFKHPVKDEHLVLFSDIPDLLLSRGFDEDETVNRARELISEDI
jgi:23S rRNA pseudouridine1911/1915/1917 synthase